MKILVTGSTGFVGSELVRELKAQGHQVVHLARHPKGTGDIEVMWDIHNRQIESGKLEGLDAVVHLAGESIFGRWTAAKKREIYESREKGTRLLSQTLANLEHPPRVMVCASAVGYYGDRGDDILTEGSAPGKNFLAEVCKAWETACQPARNAKIRVVNTRFGMILSPKGGALQMMYWPAQLGVFGNLGIGGKQYMSWVTLQDVVRAIIYAIENKQMRGPYNVCSPEPVTNNTFTTALRKRLTSPLWPLHYWFPPAPALAVKLVAGQMGEELLLASERAIPQRLEETGFHFNHVNIKETFQAIL